MNRIYIWVFVFCARFVWAGAPGHGSASINWWGLGSAYKDSPALGWLTITFLLFVVGLIWVIRKPLGLYLETRSRDIRRQIEEGARAKKEAEEKLRLYEEKLRSLDSEIENIKIQFKNQAKIEAQEKERLRKVAEARILRDVDDTIKAQVKRSKTRLAGEVIELAFEKVAQKIASQATQELDAHLIKKIRVDFEAQSGARQ